MKTYIKNLYLTELSFYCFLKKRYYFCLKMLTFCKNNAASSKIKGVLVLFVIFSETINGYAFVLMYQNSRF